MIGDFLRTCAYDFRRILCTCAYDFHRILHTCAYGFYCILHTLLMSNSTFCRFSKLERMDGEEQQRHSRPLQHVCILSAKKAIVEWMIKDVTFRGRKNLIPRTIQTFLEHFRGIAKVNFMKASR